jgi:hypothetical protein
MRRPALPALSVRARLALGNVLILALILVVLGGLLRYGAQVWLAADLDRDLAAVARRIARRPPPSPSPGPPQGNRPPNDTTSSETDLPSPKTQESAFDRNCTCQQWQPRFSFCQ